MVTNEKQTHHETTSRKLYSSGGRKTSLTTIGWMPPKAIVKAKSLFSPRTVTTSLGM
jgi:hypothetical protein